MNTINIDLFISKDFEDVNVIRKGIRKVSDKLTILKTYLPAQKKEDGTRGKALQLDTKVTTKTEVIGELVPQARVRVTGFMEVSNYTNKDGREFANPVIVASKVEVLTAENSAEEVDAENGFIAIPDDEELPFR